MHELRKPYEQFDPNGEHKANMRMIGRMFVFGAVVFGLPTAFCYLSQYVR